MKEALVPGVIGAGLCALGWFQRKKVTASLAWPSAQGIVTEATVTSEYQQGDADNPDSVTWYAVVRYGYSVNGQPFSSDSIRFYRQGYASERNARQALALYPAGKTVDVFYNPAKPQQAVLERKNAAGTGLLIIGGAILGLALIVLLSGR